MDLNEYQQRAMTTCMESCKNVAYMLTGLNAEVGEVNDKFAKAIRKEQIAITRNNLATWQDRTPDAWEANLQKEIGDCLWFLSGICSVMGWQMNDIAQQNIDKLTSRAQRGVIIGDGDNR